MRRISSIFLTTLAAFLCAGCANTRTVKAHYAGTEQMLAEGDYAAAIRKIEAAKEEAYAYKDRVVFYLDMGMLHHWNGDHETSNEFLERAERAIEENFTKSLTRDASSLILNDNALAYAGEDYEDVYLNAFKALNFLALGQTDSAFVEVRRINNKLVQLEDKYAKEARKLNEAEEAQQEFSPGKNFFTDSALGRYLSALLYRNEGRWDDVRIDFEKIEKGWKLQPALYPFSPPDFTATRARVSPTTARLNVFAFSGPGPDKKASGFQVYTEEDLIVLAGTSEDYLGKQNLSGLSVIPWYGVGPGYNFKFQLPRMVKRPSVVSRIEVAVSGVGTNELQTIESLENAAVEAFGVKKPLIYFKTLTRAITKGIATQQATAQLTDGMDDGLAILTRIAASVVVNQTENADLRLSRFFPAEAAIREIHLEEGVYDVSVNYYKANGDLLHADEWTGLSIEAGRLNVLQSAYIN